MREFRCKLLLGVLLIWNAHSFIGPQKNRIVLAASARRELCLASMNDDQMHEGYVVTDECLAHDYVVHTSDAVSSSSAKIQEAHRRCELTGDPIGDKVMIKYSGNIQSMEREVQNTEHISRTADEDAVVTILDHNIPSPEHTSGLPNESSNSGETAMIVMEKGCQDLLSYVNESSDLKGDKLSQAIRSVVSSIASIHRAGLVWSDAKLSNFIVQDEANTVKAIDLESCNPAGSMNPHKFTPSTCPPEFAHVLQACLEGRMNEVSHKVNFAFDIWSLGTIIFVMATGKSFHQKNTDIEAIAATLGTIQQHSIDCDERLDGDRVDPLVKDFILQCLKVDPWERPSIDYLMEHPLMIESSPWDTAVNDEGPSFAFWQQSTPDYEPDHLSAYEKQLRQYTQETVN